MAARAAATAAARIQTMTTLLMPTIVAAGPAIFNAQLPGGDRTRW